MRLLAQATKEDLRGGKKEGGANKTTPGPKASQKEGATINETAEREKDNVKVQAIKNEADAANGKADEEAAEKAQEEQDEDDALEAKAGEEEAAAEEDKE